MQPKKLTGHANRMRMYDITEAEVDSAIERPDFTEPSVEGRVNVWKKVDDKFLRVTLKDEQRRVLIITAVKKRKGWR